MLQICANIKQARESAGFSQVEMAGLLGLSRTTYANWEAETEPNIATIKRIAQILGVEFSQLINEPHNNNEDKLSDTALRFLNLLEKNAETMDKQQDMLRDQHDRLFAKKEAPDISDIKNDLPSQKTKTMKPVK